MASMTLKGEGEVTPLQGSPKDRSELVHGHGRWENP